MSKEALKRIRSILSAVTGLDDDDDEYIGDARKAVDQLIDMLEAQPQHEQDGCPVCGSDVHDRDALDKAEREIERLRSLVAQRNPLTDEAKAVINAARAAMDASTEANDDEGSITISSELAASLSFCLDEYDRAIEAAHGIKENT